LTSPRHRERLERAAAELSARHGAEPVRRQLADLERHGDTVDDPELWLRTAVAGDFKFRRIEKVEHCPCGSHDHTLLSRFVFWNLLGFRECRQCGLLFVSPRLTAEEMTAVFNEHYFDHSNPDFWGSRRVGIFADVARHLPRGVGLRVLDVGAAYGHFVRWMTDRGFTAVGCDISADAVALGRARLGVELHHGALRELWLEEGSLDAVISLDTLYYVPDPLAELRSMARLLRPGGRLVLRLRNGQRAATRARREARHAVGGGVIPSEHIWAFTPRTVEHLLRLCGLEVLGSEPAAYSRSPAAPLHAAAVAANRLARRITSRAPIWTLSFNVSAARPTAASPPPSGG
jgi:SAM-dependent methyltransferase